MGTGRLPYAIRTAGGVLRAVRQPSRAVPVAAAAVLLLVAGIGGCVQAPQSENAIGVPQSVAPTAKPYRPDVVPTDLPETPVPTDVTSTDAPPDLPVTAPAGPTAAGATTRTQATSPVAPTSAAKTAPAAQQTQAAAPATTEVAIQPPPPATTTAPPPATTAPVAAGPGTVSITCTHSSNRTKATLKWQNQGFMATVVVNGKSFTQTYTKTTSYTVSTAETVPGHGTCVGTVEGQTATDSY